MMAATARRAAKPAVPGRIALKRVYLPADKRDGTRILVDRLWPRGLKTDKAKVDLWLRDIAPSDDLRKWFGHDPDNWPLFRKWYRQELSRRPDLLQPIKEALEHGNVTLLFAAKDEARNNAVVLKERLEQGLKARERAKGRSRKAGTSKAEASKAEASKAEASKAEASKAGTSKASRGKRGAPRPRPKLIVTSTR
jgi:uncharacterized protein YeaO (DUF488 family)